MKPARHRTAQPLLALFFLLFGSFWGTLAGFFQATIMRHGDPKDPFPESFYEPAALGFYAIVLYFVIRYATSFEEVLRDPHGALLAIRGHAFGRKVSEKLDRSSLAVLRRVVRTVKTKNGTRRVVKYQVTLGAENGRGEYESGSGYAFDDIGSYTGARRLAERLARVASVDLLDESTVPPSRRTVAELDQPLLLRIQRELGRDALVKEPRAGVAFRTRLAQNTQHFRLLYPPPVFYPVGWIVLGLKVIAATLAVVFTRAEMDATPPIVVLAMTLCIMTLMLRQRVLAVTPRGVSVSTYVGPLGYTRRIPLPVLEELVIDQRNASDSSPGSYWDILSQLLGGGSTLVFRSDNLVLEFGQGLPPEELAQVRVLVLQALQAMMSEAEARVELKRAS